MEVKDISEIAKERKKGQRRIDLYRRENLETWVLIFPPGTCRECTTTRRIALTMCSPARAS